MCRRIKGNQILMTQNISVRIIKSCTFGCIIITSLEALLYFSYVYYITEFSVWTWASFIRLLNIMTGGELGTLLQNMKKVT